MAVYFSYFCLCTKPSQTKSGHMLNTTFFTTRLIWLKENKKKAGTVNCSSHIAKYSRTQFCYWASCMCVCRQAIFYFYIFYFRFLQKYIFDLENYRNIPRPPRCRAAGTWPPGNRAAGAYLKKNLQKITPRSLEDRPHGSEAARPPGRPAVGRRALAARVRGDRPPNPI